MNGRRGGALADGRLAARDGCWDGEGGDLGDGRWASWWAACRGVLLRGGQDCRSQSEGEVGLQMSELLLWLHEIVLTEKSILTDVQFKRMTFAERCAEVAAGRKENTP